MDNLCECIYWARESGSLFDGNAHHPKCQYRKKTVEEYINSFIKEGYGVSIEVSGTELVARITKDGKLEGQLSSLVGAMTPERMLEVLYDMSHGNLVPAQQELFTEYEN